MYIHIYSSIPIYTHSKHLSAPRTQQPSCLLVVIVLDHPGRAGPPEDTSIQRIEVCISQDH